VASRSFEVNFTKNYTLLLYLTFLYFYLEITSISFRNVPVLYAAVVGNNNNNKFICSRQVHKYDRHRYYTAAGCQGAIQLSMLAAYNFNYKRSK